ncbi:YdcF family protein [Pediococcus argentinicus]|uniref:DUF218 domain-containing protein n=1 Tax=Pediococcus argentinicus TaxID=480391 RepID=A0A0R2NBX2_9LACO|nr:YdcF family protein [Pediococcus argentinicus]KRO21995.1 hypothetical protein IV88_GL001314 [Pediococcus argentinicus]NKZ23096.1 DUF218 domain-containing protein [Pediococcus argentinicus]GEP20231.1 membrane protein [Pediococcus argentinicus]
MILLLILLAVMLISGIVVLRDRRSFFGGMFFAFSLLSLIVYVVLLLASTVSNSENGILALAIFMLLALVGIPLIAGFAMIMNTYVMQSKEGKSLTARLSLAFGVNALLTLGMGGVLLFVPQLGPILTGLILIVFGIDVTFTAVFIGYLFYSFIYQMIPVRSHLDYFVVLGAGVRSETVTPLLKSRLDKAIQYYNRQGQTGKFVVSGGQGPDEPVSEAFAMRKYLLSQNIPDEQIIMEDKSTTTLENMRFSKQKIDQDWNGTGKPHIIFSTNNYHVLRGAIYARKAKLNADGVGAPTSFYFLPSALLREYIALLVLYKWFTLAIIIIWPIIGIALML